MRFSLLNQVRVLAVLMIASCTASVSAGGRLEVEDYDLLPDGGFRNPFFLHDLQSNEFEGGSTPEQEFHQTNPDSDSGLFAYEVVTGTDFITFELAAGEHVDFASIFMASSMQFSPSVFHVIGVDINEQRLELFINSPSDANWHRWVKVDTSAAPFARITEIRLTGFAKGFFDDLTVNVVPEPATWVLMGLSLGGLVWIRRRRAAHQ